MNKPMFRYIGTKIVNAGARRSMLRRIRELARTFRSPAELVAVACSVVEAQ